eukprot:5193200-Pyramimonas_sp.AAC.1
MSDIEHDAHTRGPVQLSPGQPVRYDKTSFKGKVKAVGVRCSHDIPTNQRKCASVFMIKRRYIMLLLLLSPAADPVGELTPPT